MKKFIYQESYSFIYKILLLVSTYGYSVDLKKKLRIDMNGKNKIEIWANIQHLDYSKIINELINWIDDKGVFHE
jgi:hypothetical protein